MDSSLTGEGGDSAVPGSPTPLLAEPPPKAGTRLRKKVCRCVCCLACFAGVVVAFVLGVVYEVAGCDHIQSEDKRTEELCGELHLSALTSLVQYTPPPQCEEGADSNYVSAACLCNQPADMFVQPGCRLACATVAEYSAL